MHDLRASCGFLGSGGADNEDADADGDDMPMVELRPKRAVEGAKS